MKILVLNGSPSGKDSITLYTILYIQKCFPGHDFEIMHVAQELRSLEEDFGPCREALEEADLIIFCYPVYTFLVPSQLHRVIELIARSGARLEGKYATQVSTSKHFYDVTAHAFIQENCADLGLKYVRGLSADMDDLLTARGQEEASSFFDYVLESMKKGWYEPVAPRRSALLRTAVSGIQAKETWAGHSIAVVTDVVADGSPESVRLGAMIERFIKQIPCEVRVINLQEFVFAGGCLGCFRCASDGKCFYKDGFDQLLRDKIQSADATVYAFSIRNHSMGYTFKLYDDRQFCNGHRTVTMGKPVGYLIDGALSSEPSLRMMLEARSQVGGNFLCGLACDEGDVNREIDQLAQTLLYALKSAMMSPRNFYGTGGLKIFRDLIYTMRGMMREDHRFYRKNGFYDFPQKKPVTIAAMYLVGLIMRWPKLKKKLGNRMTEGMIMPYKKVIETTGAHMKREDGAQ